MRRQLSCALGIFALSLPRPVHAQTNIQAAYGATANRIIDRALADSAAYERLSELVDKFGSRNSGTVSLERAIDWTLAQMKADGFDNVRGEPVMVPHWVRGAESAELVSPRPKTLNMLGLGGSIATPPAGITADVLVVTSFDELRAKAAQAKGKIVVFDAPFVSYGTTVAYRRNGASEAAKVGAVAALVRSITPYSQNTPHTGAMVYDTAISKVRIPTAAITVEDAMMMHRIQDRGEKLVVRLRMQAKTMPDEPSRNPIAEIRGSQFPDEVVVLGGHIDSWDVGQGAMDDGGGVVAAWEALRVIKALGLTPKRTIRVVGWTNEENGTKGGLGYRDMHRADSDKHIVAMESDAGTFKPEGFGFSGTDQAFAVVQQIGRLLDRIGSGTITRGGGEADIGPMMELGVPGLGLNVDGTKYFWYHHTDADTIDKLDPHELALCVATMAVMAYVIADMPERLPHGIPAGR
jgi:carboxypeptidase Q